MRHLITAVEYMRRNCCSRLIDTLTPDKCSGSSRSTWKMPRVHSTAAGREGHLERKTNVTILLSEWIKHHPMMWGLPCLPAHQTIQPILLLPWISRVDQLINSFPLTPTRKGQMQLNDLKRRDAKQIYCSAPNRRDLLGISSNCRDAND